MSLVCTAGTSVSFYSFCRYHAGIIDGDMTLDFVLLFPREPISKDPNQPYFPWNCDFLHNFMVLVDDITSMLEIDHNVFVMPDDIFVQIGFPPIPTSALMLMVEFLTEDEDILWEIRR